MLRSLAAVAIAMLFAPAANAQSPGPVSLPPDTLHWQLDGSANPTEYLGRKCLHMDGAEAIAKNLVMRDGILDADVATRAIRGFFGFDFRIDDAGANFERVYLRPHESGQADAMQYTPVLHTGANWQIYNGPGFTGQVDIPKNEWFHLRLVVTGA